MLETPAIRIVSKMSLSWASDSLRRFYFVARQGAPQPGNALQSQRGVPGKPVDTDRPLNRFFLELSTIRESFVDMVSIWDFTH
jgi:hypothetical protein